MSDLISRADAIEAVASITMSIHLSDVICDKLLALPSADRPQGEWIVERAGNGWNDWINVTCNQCGKKFEKFGEHNFCPNCGADMRGGNK